MANQKGSGINYDDVSTVISDMLLQGTDPSIRGVLRVTGGKPENISRFYHEFFKKRNAEISKMADELGSSKIAELLASQVHIVVERQTKSLTKMVERQNIDIVELVELLSEKENDCNHKVDLAEANSLQAINESNEKIKITNQKIDDAIKAKNIAEQEIIKLTINTTNEIEAINAKTEQLCISEKNKADDLVEAANQRSLVLIEAAKKEADSLVKAATVQIDKAETETQLLRQQVKELTIDEAKRQIEQVHFEQAQVRLSNQQSDLAEQKTMIVQLTTEKSAFVKDQQRLENDLVDAKSVSKELSKTQGQLIEAQKQTSQLQQSLSLSERERDSLSLALATTNKN